MISHYQFITALKSTTKEKLREVLLKTSIALLFLLCFGSVSPAQVVNQVTIIPSNPTATDSIRVISDFSFFGNCTYNLVYLYSYLTDSTIHIFPTYCGYGDSTLCTSIDTFTVGPYPAGNYVVSIEYHQGSICPISGFDAVIAQFDTALVIGASTGLQEPVRINEPPYIFPNPSENYLVVNPGKRSGASVRILNIAGQVVYASAPFNNEIQIDISALKNGFYYLTVSVGNNIYSKKILIY